MNTVKAHLASIFGAKMPKTATHFFTTNGRAVFEGGRIVGMRQIPMTAEQVVALESLGFLGARGWSLK